MEALTEHQFKSLISDYFNGYIDKVEFYFNKECDNLSVRLFKYGNVQELSHSLLVWNTFIEKGTFYHTLENAKGKFYWLFADSYIPPPMGRFNCAGDYIYPKHEE